MLEPIRKTAVKNQPESLASKRPILRWVCRPQTDTRQEIPIGSSPLVLGASSSCDIVLNDPTVSSRHAEIQLVQDGIQIRDLGSTNGTYCNADKLSCMTLARDTRIRLGNSMVEICRAQGPQIPPSSRHRFGGLIGQSPAMRQIYAFLEKVSPTDVTVLIDGESGTGKEVTARAIHDHSKRADKPFVVVDCCATPEHLIESQLFGHRTGAFTGAVSERKGAFLEADGGTLFLDEMGELPLPLQGKLLRALEARTIQPLGCDLSQPVDVRVIAATNRDLQQMVDEQKFRFDLYHRLAVVSFTMPALRSHLEDIPQLVRHFYEGRGVDPGDISGENLRALMSYDWPGNVRELRNVMERALVLSGPLGSRFQDLFLMLAPPRSDISPAPSVDTSLEFKAAKEQWIDEFEKQYVSTLYSACGGNISKAAERSGINRNHFRKLLVKHGLLKSDSDNA